MGVVVQLLGAGSQQAFRGFVSELSVYTLKNARATSNTSADVLKR